MLRLRKYITYTITIPSLRNSLIKLRFRLDSLLGLTPTLQCPEFTVTCTRTTSALPGSLDPMKLIGKRLLSHLSITVPRKSLVSSSQLYCSAAQDERGRAVWWAQLPENTLLVTAWTQHRWHCDWTRSYRYCYCTLSRPPHSRDGRQSMRYCWPRATPLRHSRPGGCLNWS